MIYARCMYDNRSRVAKLTLRGHADAAPKGEDLVCAGASALALTAARAVRYLYRRRLLCRTPRIQLVPGDAAVVATARPGCEAEVLMCFWTIQAGLSALAEQYPEHITLEEVLRV